MKLYLFSIIVMTCLLLLNSTPNYGQKCYIEPIIITVDKPTTIVNETILSECAYQVIDAMNDLIKRQSIYNPSTNSIHGAHTLYFKDWYPDYFSKATYTRFVQLKGNCNADGCWTSNNRKTIAIGCDAYYFSDAQHGTYPDNFFRIIWDDRPGSFTYGVYNMWDPASATYPMPGTPENLDACRNNVFILNFTSNRNISDIAYIKSYKVVNGLYPNYPDNIELTLQLKNNQVVTDYLSANYATIKWKSPTNLKEVTTITGNPVKLSAPEAPVGKTYSYVWSNGETTREVLTDVSGLYTVSITSSDECFGVSETIKVTAASGVITPLATLTHIDAPCPLTCPENYADGKIALAVSPTLPEGQSYTYKWYEYNANSTNSDKYDQLVPETASLENLKIGTYKVVVKNTTTNSEVSRIYQVNRPVKWATDGVGLQFKAKNISQQEGDWMEFVANTNSQNTYWIGLSTDNTSATTPQIMNYAVKIVGNSSNTNPSGLSIYESPVPNSTPIFQRTLSTGDVVRIQRTATKVEYYVNNVKLTYNSAILPNTNQVLSIRGFTEQGILPTMGTNTCPPCNGDDNYNYVRTYIYNTPIKTEASCLSPKYEDEVQVSTQYFDGLGRPIQSVAHSASPTQNDIIQAIAYDAFGRQTISYSPYTVKPDECARFRPNAIIEQALFYKDGATDAELSAAGVTKEANMAKTAKPFAQTDFEASPLNRVLRQGAVGEPWQITNTWNPSQTPNANDRSVKAFTRTNNALESPATAPLATNFDAVRRWAKNGAIWDGNQVYALNTTTGEGQLMVTETFDEHNKKVIQYTDKESKTILKRVETGITATPWADTYYLYDDFGRLMFVIQPEGVRALANAATNKWLFEEYKFEEDLHIYIKNPSANQAIRNGLMFQYRYDERGRQIGVFVPGKGDTNNDKWVIQRGWEWMVYDSRDRLVLKKSLRNYYEWVYTKYDFLNRPLMSALWLIYNNAANSPYTGYDYTTQTMARVISDFRASIAAQTSFFELTRLSVYLNENNQSFPARSQDLYTGGNRLFINKYDNYDFDNNGSEEITIINNQFISSSTNRPLSNRGRLTGVMTQSDVLSGSTNLKNVTFYDKYGRAVQTQSDNHILSREVNTNSYDFSGKLITSYLQHRFDNTASKNTVTKTLDYDHTGRLIGLYSQVDAQDKVLLAQNTYNELGQLVGKNTHSLDEGITDIQTIAYAYHVRGWLKKINDFKLGDAKKLFSFELDYENPIVGNTKQFNGNISATKWLTENAPTGKQIRSYSYTYDAMNRLKKANYSNPTNTSEQYSVSGVNIADTDEGIIYDLNGNIKNITQQGAKTIDANGIGTAWEVIDKLTYTYFSNSNRLRRVADARGANGLSGDFKDENTSADDYVYDYMGGLRIDNNKTLSTFSADYTDFTVNASYWGKPKVLFFGTTKDRSIKFSYSSDGSKQRKEVRNGTTNPIKVTDYISGFVYEYIVPYVSITTAIAFPATQAPSFLATEEGRIVNGLKKADNATDIAFGHPDSYEYSYKDHLGNLRLSYRPQTASEAKDILTFEEPTPAVFTYTGTKEPNKGYLSTNAGKLANGQKITRTRFGVPTGTIIKAKVFSTWKPVPVSNQPVLPILPNNAIYSSPVLALSPTNVGEVLTPIQVNLTGVQTLSSHSFQRPSKAPQTPPPTARLLVNVYEKVTGKLLVVFSQNVSEAGKDKWEELSIGLTAKVAVDIEVVCENTSTTAVFFDNLEVKVQAVPTVLVVQENHYYPFGLGMRGLDWTLPTNAKEDKFTYNGKEKQMDFDLGWSDYGARQYDPQCGCFRSVDPLADKMVSWSPYNYVFNNPIRFIDPDGKAPLGDFLNEKGELVGNDGKKDGKVYVIKTSQTEFDSGVPSAGITAEQANQTEKFIKDNSGNAEKFSEGSIAYTNSVGIEGSAHSRKRMTEIVSADDGKGGKKDSNNSEYGGTKTDKVIPSIQGTVADPSKVKSASISHIMRFGVRTTFHSHPSGDRTSTEIDNSNSISPKSITTTHSFAQAPSQHDINNSGSQVHYVFGRGNGTVYIHDNSGVIATIPQKYFVTPKQ